MVLGAPNSTEVGREQREGQNENEWYVSQAWGAPFEGDTSRLRGSLKMGLPKLGPLVWRDGEKAFWVEGLLRVSDWGSEVRGVSSSGY